MRLKVRIDSDKPGLFSWLAKLLGGGAAKQRELEEPPEQETAELPAMDWRWESYAGENGAEWRVLGAGRNTKNSEMGIESEYVFRAVGEKRQAEFRVVLPETLVGVWESAAGRRMTEAERLGAAKQRLQRMLAEGGPERGVVDELN